MAKKGDAKIKIVAIMPIVVPVVVSMLLYIVVNVNYEWKAAKSINSFYF